MPSSPVTDPKSLAEPVMVRYPGRTSAGIPAGPAARGHSGRAAAARPAVRVAAAVLTWFAPLAAGLSTPPPLLGQAQDRGLASPLVPADHWSLDAVRRLYALGLVDAYDPGHGRISMDEMGTLLGGVLWRAADGPYESMARAYVTRFGEEWGWSRGPAGRQRRNAVEGEASAGIERQVGLLRTGEMRTEDGWSGPAPVGGWRADFVTADLRFHPFSRLAAGFGYRSPDLVESIRELYAVARLMSGLEAWGGRRGVRYGPGLGGTVVLAGNATFTGGGVATVGGVRLPGLLAALGPTRLQTFAARLDESGPLRRPWFWGARASFMPGAGFGIGLNRGAVFGGEGGEPVTARNVADMLIGRHAGEDSHFANQVASVDLWLRRWIGPLPLLAYVEWGFEDSAGAWKNVPGVVAGVETPAVPVWPALALGAEYARFSSSCCGNPIWYRHAFFQGGWTDSGFPLGHALGGHGAEASVNARGFFRDGLILVSGRAFRRDRGHENLYAPDREGRSVGGRLGIEIGTFAAADVVLDGALERGDDGWRQRRVSAAVRMRF